MLVLNTPEGTDQAEHTTCQQEGHGDQRRQIAAAEIVDHTPQRRVTIHQVQAETSIHSRVSTTAVLQAHLTV